jgi:DNA-binding transcriptional MerR regulator
MTQKPVVRSDFISSELQALSGLGKHMVDYLCRHGLLTASGSKDRGFGKRRRFSFADVLLARTISKLLEAGVSVLAMRAVLRHLGQQLRTSAVPALRDTRVAICNGKPYLSEPNKPPTDLLAGGQMVFSFTLDVEELWKKAGPLRARRLDEQAQRTNRALRTRRERMG